MSKNLQIIFALTVILIIAFAIHQFTENQKKKRIIQDLQDDNLRLIRNYIKNASNISESIKIQLLSLVENYIYKHPKIAKELTTVLAMINSQEDEKGVGSLSIIIEDLLKLKYQNNLDFENWCKSKKKKNIVLADYIEYAKEIKFFDKEECIFASAVRNIRNGVFHEAGKKLSPHFSQAGLLAGIGLIIKLGESLRLEGLL